MGIHERPPGAAAPRTELLVVDCVIGLFSYVQLWIFSYGESVCGTVRERVADGPRAAHGRYRYFSAVSSVISVPLPGASGAT